MFPASPRITRAPRRRRDPRDERGTALVIAIGVMAVLTIAGTALVAASSSNSRSTDYSNADNRAASLAETGANEALAVLNEAANALDPATLPGSGPLVREGGTVQYSGSLSGDTWTITSQSTVANPTGPGAAAIQDTATVKAQVRALVPGATPAQWDRIFDNSTDCLTISGGVEIPSSITTRGGLCLEDGAKILRRTEGGESYIEIGGNVVISPTSSAGRGNDPLDWAEIGGTCKFAGQQPRRPCRNGDDKIYAARIGARPENLTKPVVDLQYWYENAKPGPRRNCTVGSFPGGFDNNTTHNNSRTGSAEITPAFSSYSCKYIESGERVGEISWNHQTHVLTIHGTIAIDGDLRFDDDGQLVNYQGRGIIYAAGDLEFDEVVCAGGNGTRDCWNDPSDWDPEENMMIVLTGGWSEYDQGATLPLRHAAFQGVMYAEEHCLVHQGFRSSGPIICEDVRIQQGGLGQGGGWPSFYSWPPLESLIPAQLYGDPTRWDAGFDVEVLEQT